MHTGNTVYTLKPYKTAELATLTCASTSGTSLSPKYAFSYIRDAIGLSIAPFYGVCAIAVR